jgi:hypothetical protein
MSLVHPLLTLAIYILPFVAIVIAARLWMRRKVSLSEVQSAGDPNRERARFLLGVWRRDDRG